jgi:DNA-binding MarR family transcriptional regulator
MGKTPIEVAIEVGSWRTTDPDTSAAAAKRVHASRLMAIVVDELRRSGPLTTEEISDRVREPLQSITPRMAPLVAKGLVYRTTDRRAGASRRARIVWSLTEIGRAR